MASVESFRTRADADAKHGKLTWQLERFTEKRDGHYAQWLGFHGQLQMAIVPGHDFRNLVDVFPETKFERVPVPRRGIMQLAPGQGEDGYGRKISMDYVALVGKRRYRVYCCCYSNNGTVYVSHNDEWLIIRDQDIPDAVRYGG